MARANTAHPSSPVNTFRPDLGFRIGSRLVRTLLTIGLPVGDMALISIRGRRSGQMRTTPVYLGGPKNAHWVVSPFGEVDWVKNLRRAGEATITRRRRSESVVATEVPPSEASGILRQALAKSPKSVRQHYGVTEASSDEAFAREALRHPVFRFAPKPSES